MAGDADRRARLAAIAAGGTAGANSYDQAQQELQARKVAAIDSMTADTSRLGGGQAQQDALNAMVGDPYDLGGQVAGTASSDISQQLGTMAAGTAGVGAGTVPVVTAKELPWGGFGTESTYEKAVEGKALADREQSQQGADTARVAAENEKIANNAQQFAAQVAAQQAASTMAPGTVIHGPGQEPTPVPPAQQPFQSGSEFDVAAANNLPVPGQPGRLDSRAAQSAADKALNIGLSTPTEVAKTGAPYDELLGQIGDPNNLYKFERQAALGFGADPYATLGRFQPPTDAEQLKAAQDKQALDYYLQSGFSNPGDQRSATEAADYLNRQDLARQAGITPDLLGSLATDTRLSPEQIVSAMSDDSWGAIGQLAQGASNFDDFQTKLLATNNAAPQDQKLTPEEMRVALAYYGPLLGK